MKILKLKHDEFFRGAISKSEVREFLDTHLPDSLKSILDLNQIKIENDSFIAETLKESICDVLLSVSFRDSNGSKDGNDNSKQKKIFIYRLIEDQSSPKHFIAVRMIKYMLLICEQFLTTNPKSNYLPLVSTQWFFILVKDHIIQLQNYLIYMKIKNLLKRYLLMDIN